MRLSVLSTDDALALTQRVEPAFRPVWNHRPAAERAALARYFLPHNSAKPQLTPTRPRMIKWYCPFACQSHFPTGHRYCINVYTGCSHGCVYCYAASYSPAEAACKERFATLIAQDAQDLEQFDVPPAPVHLSNSTDPFQPLESQAGHTRIALETILAHRRRFTSVTILTKNPLLPVKLGYLGLFKELAELPPGHPRQTEFAARGLPGFCMEVSLAFWRDEARAAYDPYAPTVQERIEGVRALRQAGIPVVLRIDPLLPRSPLTGTLTMDDLGLAEAQMLEDLDQLVALAREIGARHVVYSPMKIVQPRGRKLDEIMRKLRGAYERMAEPQKLVFRGGSWRLPPAIAQERITAPFLEICRRHSVPAKFCMANLVETP